MAGLATRLTGQALIDKCLASIAPEEDQINKTTFQIKKEKTVEYYYAARNLELQYLVRMCVTMVLCVVLFTD
jgi:predicted S18 family serine protease